MEKLTRRKRCPKCRSLNTIRWGIRNGKQRYKCSDCEAYFIVKKPAVRLSNQDVWFKSWILGKSSISTISKSSGYSSRHLQRIFEDKLSSSPVWKINTTKSKCILVDGTWYAEKECLIVYRDVRTRKTLYYRFCKDELEWEIIKDLESIRSIGIRVFSFTTDGGQDIIQAIKYIYPKVHRQRCLVHIERECLMWITQHPKSSAGIALRRIVFQICYIKTNNDKLFWIRQFHEWHQEYGEFINQKSINKETGEWTYTHDNIRRAYIHINNALPNMFKYINHPIIPNNTNSLESFFGHLKDNLRIHRGLTLEHKQGFIKWYLYYSNEKEN